MLFLNKKSSYCHEIGVVGVGVDVAIGVTNFNLEHTSEDI